MKRPGHLVLKLRPGCAVGRLPSHLDILAGAGRPANEIDRGGRIDRTLSRHVDAFRASCVFHSRRSLGRIGEQSTRFDDLEEDLGLSRTVAVVLSDPDRSEAVVQALRDLDGVESAAVQTLAQAPLDAGAPPRPIRITKRKVWEPHERVGAPEALSMEAGDRRTITAAVDTGVALGHPEFQGKLWVGFDTVDLGMGLVGGVRLFGDSSGRDFKPADLVGHGTQVAGVIGARGEKLPPGLAGRSPVMPLRVLGAARVVENGKLVGVGGLIDIDLGIKVALDIGAKVLNLSFGTPASALDDGAPRPHADIMRYAMARGAVLVAAAGNSGEEEDFYPAALPEAIAVGSVDAEGRRSKFSTYGDHIALCAPGECIVSTGLSGYRQSSGTSFAAPFVTGVAALLVSRAKKAGQDLDGRAVKRLLTESATPLTGGVNPETGHGLLDGPGALRRLDEALAARTMEA